MEELKLFGLVGKSLKHSFSEKFFKKKFAIEGYQNCDYRNFELQTIDEFLELLNFFPELLAINVTHPFKEKILKFIDIQDSVVAKIGAANVVIIKNYEKKRVLKAYNTDVYGIESTLLSNLKNLDVKALILGTGGSAKSLSFVLNKLNIEFDLVSRTQQKGVKYLYQDLSKRVILEHRLIINTTPLGMFPKIDYALDIPYEFITENHLLIDFIYNPAVTKFLEYGKKAGATIVNGKEMLIKQAEESWSLFCSA